MFIIILFSNKSLGQSSYKYDAANRIVQISSNCAGTLYTYDANGNRLSTNEVSIVTTSKVIDERCGKDGKIVITAQDTTVKYKYAWSNGKTTGEITSLVGGTYSVVITEPVTGFTCDQTFKINGIFKDSIRVDTQQITCNGAKNGKARIVIVTPDTVGSYLYHWSTSKDTSYRSLDSLANLAPGNYSVAVRNTHSGCVRSFAFTITEPPVLITGIAKTDAACTSGSDGTAKVTVGGDSNDYTYSWTGPFSGTKTTQEITGLSPGKYTVTVSKNGTECTLSKSIDVNPILADATITPNGPTAFYTGGNVVLSANTGSGYSYQWLKNGNELRGENNSTYTATDSGSYAVRIAVNTCALTSKPIVVVSKFTLPADNFTVTTFDETCRGKGDGRIIFTASADMPYSAKLTKDGVEINSQTFTNASPMPIEGLAAESYQLCFKVEGQEFERCYDITIGAPKDLAVLNVTVNNTQKTLHLSLSGGTTYSIKLNGSTYTTTNTDITLPALTGRNQVSVTTDRPCQGLFERDFVISDGIAVYPAPFERNLLVGLGGNTSPVIGVKVYNAVGTLMYSGTVNNNSGSMTVPLPDLKKGVYLMQLSISSQWFKILRK